MNERIEIPLLTTPSRGRREPQLFRGEDGEVVHVNTWGGEPCPGCDEMTALNDPVTKLNSAWWHARCAKTRLSSMTPAAAWITLASQVAAAPRKFNVTTIRTVIEQLTHLAERGAGLPEWVDPMRHPSSLRGEIS